MPFPCVFHTASPYVFAMCSEPGDDVPSCYCDGDVLNVELSRAGGTSQEIANLILFTSGGTSTSDRSRPVVGGICERSASEASSQRAGGPHRSEQAMVGSANLTIGTMNILCKEGGQSTVKEAGCSLTLRDAMTRQEKDRSRASKLAHCLRTPSSTPTLNIR